MPCQILDRLGYMAPDGTFVPLEGQQIVAVPGSNTYRVSYAGNYRPLIGLNPLVTSAALKHGVVAQTDPVGEYSFTLPYSATETNPSTPTPVWSLVFPDGSIATGPVPSVAGPITVDELLGSHSWVWASQVYVAPVTAGTFAKGTATFSASSSATIVFAAPFVTNAYQIELTPSTDSNDGTIPRVAWGTKTTTGFVINTDGSFTGSVDWSAQL